MRIGRFEHNPGILKTALFLLFLSALLALGTWQMHRAAEKKVILAAAQSALSAKPVAASDLGDLALAATQHTKVRINGKYHGEKQFLWDNRVHKGQAGYEVITPVRTESGLVLVNRGWVAPGRTRQELPDIKLTEAIGASDISITGLFSRPSKGFLNGDAFEPGASWPIVLQYFDYDAIEDALGEPVLHGIVQPQQFGNDSNVNQQANRPEGNGTEFYIPNWEPTAAIGPTRHYGYAFQWYAMAAALVILFFVYNTRRIESV